MNGIRGGLGNRICSGWIFLLHYGVKPFGENGNSRRRDASFIAFVWDLTCADWVQPLRTVSSAETLMTIARRIRMLADRALNREESNPWLAAKLVRAI